MKSLHSTRSKGVIIFLSCLLALAVAAALACIISPRKISTSFTSMIPQGGVSDSMLKAESAFTEGQNANVNIFVSGKDFPSVKDKALKLFSKLEACGAFESITLESTALDTEELFSMVSDNVYLLLDSQTQKRIEDNLQAFQNDSLASIFSAFTVSSLSNLDNDPFLLSETVWLGLLEKVGNLTTFSPKEGVLCTEIDGIWYVMISGKLSSESLSLAGRNSGIESIFRICDELTEDGIEISCSGLAFHSYESASGAQNEITIISIVSVALILIMFFLLCRNFHILWLFAMSLAIATGSAVAALLLFFREIHVLSMIFGTTLIGTCIDYSIHSYMTLARKARDEEFDLRKKLGKSLTVSFVSTELCYLVLLFSSYGILKQMAIISLVGLLSSYLVAMVLYPRILTEKMINRNSFAAKSERKISIPLLLPLLAIAATVLLLVQIPRISIHNDITSLYTPSERMLKGEETAGKATGYLATTYAIVEGDSENDVLEKEYAFTKGLDDLKSQGIITGYIATTSFVPPQSVQTASLNAARLLLLYLDEQCDILGVPDENKKQIIARLSDDPVFFTASSLPEGILSMLSSISLGEIDGRFYEVVIIQNATDGDLIKAAADSFDGVEYFQTSKDVSRELDKLSALIFRMFLLAFAAIIIVLVILFGWKKGLLMSLAPYTVLTTTIGVMVLLGFKLDFFVAVGLVLIVGLGLDYMVFARSEKNSGSKKAIFLSFVTTELSFGSLLFSSFRPVHIFGLTVFIGILVAFLCAIGAEK
ncbi:MAG: MMPL family transporter [Spirochaetales bacterium]|nr:MMPL family transporter [Spirochaetales bacterium]